MLSSITAQSTPQQIIIIVFSFLMIMLVSMPFHECAHGLAASFLGDSTAKNSGRLTLDPFSHIDPMGAIAMLLFGIGWAKPVPVSPASCTRFKHIKPKGAMAIIAAAGPLSNLLLAYIFMIAMRVVFNANYSLIMSGKESAAFYIYEALYNVASININLAVFNLLPIPPFDGSRIFLSFLPTKIYFKIMKYEKIIMGIMLVLLLLGVFSSLLLICNVYLNYYLQQATNFVDYIVKIN
ncbi:MAG: site-2 protease family protein [Firmicutes bacterium]|nr:site-2 protease family protein [Bacillota bacterium]